MEDRQLVSPFSNTVAADLLATFVGRSLELARIRSWFEADRKAVVIVGSAGSGKTALTRVFAHQNQAMFAGGVYISSANWAEAPEHLFGRVLPHSLTAKTLMIIDDVEAFEDMEIAYIKSTVRESQYLNLLLTSRRSLESLRDCDVLVLPPLTRSEFDQLLRKAGAHSTLDDQVSERLFDVAAGSPVFAKLAASVVGERHVASWEELLTHLRTFRTPGLLGPDGRPLARGTPAYTRMIVDVTSINDEIIRIVKGNPNLIWSLPPRRFEEIVAQILSKQGYEIELTPASGDGGFDIYAARKEGLGKFLYLVECKRYIPPNKVGVEIVRGLYGVLQAKRATAGAIVTTSFFTSGAEEFQREVQHQLYLHDYISLQKWIKDFPLETA